MSSNPSQNKPMTRLIPAAELALAFTSGASFVENSEYRIGVARRDGPGDAEVHDVDTDIFYVLDGKATLITGGVMVEPRLVGPNETRALCTEGGEAKVVSKGDMIIIPCTVPHWFSEVSSAPFVYLVVKSTAR